MWIAQIPHLLVAIVVAYLPGLVILISARMPFLAKIALAPAVSIAAFAGSATVVNAAGRPWGTLSAVAGTAGIAVVMSVFGIVRRVRGSEGPNRQNVKNQAFVMAQYLIGIIVVGVFVALFLLPAFHGPDSIAQRYDNAFHLNAIAGIINKGTASPFTLAWFSGGGFYPPGWHEYVALTMLVSGASLTAAIHMCTFVVVFLIWPLSNALILETAMRPKPAVRILLGTASLLMVSFPYAILQWGLLYPNLLGFALAPALAALVIQLCTVARWRQRLSIENVCLLLIVVFGVAMAHPNAVFAALAFAGPAVVIGIIRRLSGKIPQSIVRNRVEATLLGAALVVLAVSWRALRPGLAIANWHQYETSAQAVGEFLSGTSVGLPGFKGVTIVALVGVAFLFRDRATRWALWGIAVIGCVFVVGAGWGDGTVRDLVVGIFYRDVYRTGMLSALAGVFLCCYGVDRVLGVARMAIRGRYPNQLWTRGRRYTALSVAAVVLCQSAIIVWLPHSGPFNAVAQRISNAFDDVAGADILSANERKMMTDIKALVPPDSVIVNNAWDGSGLIYAFADRKVTNYYLLSPKNADDMLFDQRLQYAATDPQVCQAVRAESARYYVKFGSWAIANNAKALDQPGFRDIQHAKGFTLVAQEGDAMLYRIDACG